VFVDTKAHPDKYSFLNPIYFPNQQEWSTYNKAYDKVERAVYKQGSNGISWMECGVNKQWLPAITPANQIVSVAGAGDTVIACFAYQYLKSRGDIGSALDFANRGAAVVVRKPYTSTTSLKEINDLN
jgi:sugar/nucleoside kinase (ribokinase family)